MALTTTMYTALSGLNVNSRNLDVIGNNIANVNTQAFKSSRAIFTPQFSSSFNFGTAPGSGSGGTNPNQVGLGVMVAGMQRNFNTGTIQPTGVGTDMAIEGAGFFIVQQGANTRYTRAGQFTLNGSNQLVSPNGWIVQGWGVDSGFNVVRGSLEDMAIPLGTMTIADATRNVNMAGNLNASGVIATQGAVIQSQAMFDTGTGALALAGANLTSLSNTAAGAAMFSNGDVVTIRGLEKGGKSIDECSFQVGAVNTTGSTANGTTVQDLMNFISDIAGINTTTGGAGVALTNGQITITGNSGTINDLVLQSADVTKTTAPAQPFTWTKAQAANGESVRTSFVVYDSLGSPLTVDLSMVLEDRGASGTSWRYYAESKDDTRLGLALETGQLGFDTFGQQITGGTVSPTINVRRTGTGAMDPLSFVLAFNTDTGGVTALTDTKSQLASVSQDGLPIGTLDSFSIGEDGKISGAFSNGLTRTIGQIALATFTNSEGLVDAGGNTYRPGPNSGSAVIVEPLSFGSGRVVAGSLELSNVDLSQEFVNLITASTGFSASSRVITTSDQLIQQLLAIGR